MENFIQVSTNGYFNVGCGTCAAAHFNANTFQYADDIDIIRGRHQMAFGVNYIRYQLNFINQWNRNGAFTFNGSTAAGAISTGDSLADLLTGTLMTLTQSNTLDWAARAPIFSLYAQDTFKLSDRITINMGLRWEPNIPSYDYFGRGSYFSRCVPRGAEELSFHQCASGTVLLRRPRYYQVVPTVQLGVILAARRYRF